MDGLPGILREERHLKVYEKGRIRLRDLLSCLLNAQIIQIF